MSDREQVINDQQRQIEELEERLAIVLEGQPEIIRCGNCAYFEPENAEEGDASGHCRNRRSPCENQMTDMMWFCADGEREEK